MWERHKVAIVTVVAVVIIVAVFGIGFGGVAVEGLGGLK